MRFFEVSSEELVAQRQSFKDGQLAIRIEDDIFDMAKHNAFINSIAAETAAFKAVQQEASAKQVRSRCQTLDSLTPETHTEGCEPGNVDFFL